MLIVPASPPAHAPGLAFPGGGIFFWWQAGAVTALSRRYRLGEMPCVGASAGALTASLAACDVDMNEALDVAVRLAEERGLWTRGAWGLYGIWGPMVHDWLDELLPPDAADVTRGRLHIVIKRAPRLERPWLEPLVVRDFTSKSDLIDANLASAHVPLFLNGRLTAHFRGMRCVDGSLSLRPSSSRRRVVLPHGASLVRIEPREDERMRDKYRKREDFLRLTSRAGVEEMMAWGEAYVDEMARNGELAVLAPFER